MSSNDGPKLVIALFPFRGKNNDELCFRKGDIITITQTDNEGWWEGTLNEKTGWFPANYVKEYKPTETGLMPIKLSPDKNSPELPHLKLNRDIVLKDIIDSERANVAELQGLITTFLQPLESINILKKEEYKQLIGNIHEVLGIHQRLLSNLDSTFHPGSDSKIGNLFLTLAPKIKSIHLAYCKGHPQAVCILDLYRDELNDFMEQNGALSPGILVLTTGLSKPFRRLEKYYALLHELERHTEECHPDRGDTQRSASVYRDISECCAAARKERELALLVLSGGIKGWEGEELNTLGNVLHIGPVTLISGNERKDRYFVLFPSTLLVLSTSVRMSSFIYEGKLPLTGISVKLLDQMEEFKNAFEICGPMIEKIFVLCQSKDERQQWIELLSQERNNLVQSPTLSHMSSHSLKQMDLGLESSPSPKIKPSWSIASLRPAPPIYVKSFRKPEETCRSPNINERQFEDDALILKVIEGYCLTVNTRLTIHSAMMDCDSLNKVPHNLSYINNKSGNWDECENRNIFEAFKALKSEVLELQTQVSNLAVQLEEEKKSRLSLSAAVQRSIAITESAVP